MGLKASPERTPQAFLRWKKSDKPDASAQGVNAGVHSNATKGKN